MSANIALAIYQEKDCLENALKGCLIAAYRLIKISVLADVSNIDAEAVLDSVERHEANS